MIKMPKDTEKKLDDILFTRYVCKLSEHKIHYHFADASKMIKMPKDAKKK